MHTFWIVLFALIAAFWVFYGLRGAIAIFYFPSLDQFPGTAGAENLPRISMIFAARDEQEKLPRAIKTLSTIAYPNLEIIAVDDRSKEKRQLSSTPPRASMTVCA